MAQTALRQERSRRGFFSRYLLVVCTLLTTPPLVFAEILQNMHYVYDEAGNVTRIGDQITLPNTQTLTYDDLDRLDVATGNYGIFDYNYDAIGNLAVNPQLGGGSTTYAYRSDGVRPHAVCAIGVPGAVCPSTNPPYDYDANGNLVNGGGRSYIWNLENKPTSITSGVTSSTGLVAAFAFNEGTGSTIADASGNNNTGALTGGYTWTLSGKYGAGLTFDGTTGYGLIAAPAPSLQFTNAMTVEVWMNAATLPTGWHTLISRQFGTSFQDSWGLFTRGTNVEFYAGSTDFVAAPITVGQWYHVAGVIDGTTIRVYINGALIATGTTTVPIPNDANEVVIGASSNGNPQISEFFNGTLDEIRVYNRALSQAEIQTDMNTPITASPSGLMAAYGFNEGTGTTAADSSGTSSAATLTNVAWTAQGKYGTGLTFDGTNSYGQISPPATPLRLTTAMTVEVWMNATTLPTGWHTLMSRQFGTGGADSWGLFTRGTTVEFWTNSTDFIAAPVTSGTWTHVAGVLDGTAVRLYVNSMLVATGTTTVPIPNDDNEVVIGASSNGNPLISEFFNGTLDEIRVYNRALSQVEIQTDMNTPITVAPSGSITTTFVYDGDGGRVKKSVGATTTRYISKLYECDDSSCTRYIWAGDTRIAIVPDNPTSQPCNPACYLQADHLGSTNLVTDATGARVETITYRPYGYIHSDSPGTPVNTPYKYTGQERDASTALYYYEARYYDPRLGRFISPDSIVSNLRVPQDLNRYAYARNNPMLYTDPSGHCPICIGIGIGILIGVISSGIQSDWDLKSTLIGGVIGGASAGVGAGVASSVYSATLSALGSTWAGVAGGVVGGAAAGGTSAVLANAAGYRVNIGLAIASGAAAGGITGGAYGQWGELGALATAPVAGASAAAISGADPGVGALIAASTAAFSLGIQELAGQLAPAQMGTRTGISGNKLSMTDVADALDVIGKSNLVVDPPPGFADSPGIAAKLNTMFESGDIIFGQTYREGARAQTWLGKITLNSRNINAGFCPKCDLPGTLFHEGVHAFYGDRFTNAFVENRAFLFQYKLEMSLYNDPAARIKPLSPPQLYQVR